VENNQLTKDAYEQLWHQFAKGDMRAFRRIYANFYPHLIRFGLLYLDKTETENAVQDVFLYILQHRNKLSKVSNVKAYLFTALRNRISKLAQANKIDFEVLSPDIWIEKQENIFADIIQSIIKKLSPREQEIIRLKYYKDLKNKEIAERLDIEYQTVRNTLHNAVRKLRILVLKTEIA